MSVRHSCQLCSFVLGFLQDFLYATLTIVCTLLFRINILLQEGKELDIYLDNLLETRTRGERNTKTESGDGCGLSVWQGNRKLCCSECPQAVLVV